LSHSSRKHSTITDHFFHQSLGLREKMSMASSTLLFCGFLATRTAGTGAPRESPVSDSSIGRQVSLVERDNEGVPDTGARLHVRVTGFRVGRKKWRRYGASNKSSFGDSIDSLRQINHVPGWTTQRPQTAFPPLAAATSEFDSVTLLGIALVLCWNGNTSSAGFDVSGTLLCC